jgi:putative acetyltransferase
MSRPYTVRPFAAADAAAVREINRQAFRTPEPGTFEKLRDSLADARAWVAVDDAGRVVGHIIFTPAAVDVAGRELDGMGLGELAVLPEVQRQGAGTLLGEAGLGALRDAGCPFVIVVGHAGYYPRFGFRPGWELGLRCQWEKVPEASFMALVLDATAMRGASGIARFRDIA